MSTLSHTGARGPRRALRRMVSALLAGVLLAQAAVADAAASSLWADRRRSGPPPVAAPRPLSTALAARLQGDDARRYSSLILPSLGTLRSAAPRSGPRRGAVLLIQDVHLNAEAQRHIASAVAALAAQNAVGLVALEGTDRALPMAPLRSFPDAESMSAAADFLLERGQVSGAVCGALRAATAVPVRGIDDAALHAENADAYRASAAARPAFLAAVAAEHARIAAAKPRVFNRDLLSFDARVADYRAGRAGFAVYLGALTEEAGRAQVSVPAELGRFIEASRLESTLDLPRVERERTAALARMSSALSAGDAASLLRAGVAFRAGEMRHADFYRTFAALAARANVAEKDIPELRRYLRYLALADGVDGAGTLRQADALEAALFARLARTDAERALVAADRVAHLADKLSTFALTRDEWRAWSSVSRPFANAAAFERFYVAAERRDAALAGNFLARIQDTDARSAVAVVGGFHADGLSTRLAAAGYDVALFTPALTRVDGDGSAYLSVFSREKTPLEQMFEGQKLFLASDPLSDAAAFSLADLASARALRLGRTGDVSAVFAALKLRLVRRDVNADTVRHTVSLPDGSTRTVDTDVGSDGRLLSLPRVSTRATGTFALGKRLFAPFSDRWVELTLRTAHVLELPQIYLSAFSRRFRDAFLTPGPTLDAKRGALDLVHAGMAVGAAIGAASTLALYLFVGGVPTLSSVLSTGLLTALGGAAVGSLFPALWIHDLMNANPETRLTEGDPGSYPDRLRAYLAGLSGAPNASDAAFQLISSETRDLLRAGDQREAIREAWLSAYENYRAPFQDLLIAVFRSWARIDPNHVIPPVEQLVTDFSRHADRDAMGPLIEFVVDAFSTALAENFRGKKDEMWARDSEPLRVLEVTPEVRPFRMSGGMAVVNGELPNELNKFHAWSTTVSLYYEDGKYDLDGEGSPFTRKEKMPFELRVTIAGEVHVGEVFRVRRRSDDGTYADFYFIRDTWQGSDNLTRRLYPTERRLHQAVFLSEGALQLMKELRKAGGKRFDILRAHDWVAGLAAIYVKTRAYAEDADMRDALQGVQPMAFLHNLEPGYKGQFSEHHWHLLGLDDSHKQAFGWTHVSNGENYSHYIHGFDPHHMSVVKALTHHVAAMFVPAPRYAEIIRDETYGYEMATMFRARAHVLFGILNGTEYDPKDELLFPKGRRPVEDFLEHRERAKLLLLKETGLYAKIEEEVRAKLTARDGSVHPEAFAWEMAAEIDRPILGAVLRLDPKMKGVWFFKSVGERLTHPDTPRPIRIVLLGSPLKGQDESEEFVRQMSGLAAARPSKIAFFPIGRQALSEAGRREAARLNLGRKITSLNDLIQAATIGFYPSKVEPGGLADVESMERGAPVIVSDKGGFYDKARDFDDDTITDREPTGAVFRGDYTDHEGMIRLVERVVNLYYNDRDRFNRIAANNKNVRFTMHRMARTHVVSMARVIGRTDIAETPEKPVHRPTADDSARINSPAPAAPADDAPISLRDATSSDPAVSGPALSELENRLFSDSEKVRSEALQTLAKAGRLDRELLTATMATRAEELLDEQQVPMKDLAAVATILIQARPFVTPRALRAMERTLTTLVLPREATNQLLEAIVLIGAYLPAAIEASTFRAVETVTAQPGLRPSDYQSAVRSLAALLRFRPDMSRATPRTVFLLGLPAALQRQPWAHYDFFAMNPFPEGMDVHDRYSVGLVAERLLARLRLPVTRDNAARAVNAILARRAARANEDIIGPDHAVITITHSEDRFTNAALENLALRAGVPAANIAPPLKGRTGKRAALDRLIASRGKVAFLFDGHGGPNHLWLEKLTDDVSDDLFDPSGISYMDLGDALLESARRNGDVTDLSRVTLLFNSCYSYDFAEQLLKYLTTVGVTRMPTIITAANKNAVAYGSVTFDALAGRGHGRFTYADFYAAERAGFANFDFTDFALFDDAGTDVAAAMGSSRDLKWLELGFASPTAKVLDLLGVRTPAVAAAAGGLIESLFVVFAIPAFFAAVALPAGIALQATLAIAFPALHLFGAMSAVRGSDGTRSLLERRPTLTRLGVLLALGLVFHLALPAAFGVTAHVALNVLLVLGAPRLSVEESLAINVANAAEIRARDGASGAAWQAAMRALIDGRAARVGVNQFGSVPGGTLADRDGENFDGAAFNRALERELKERRLLHRLSSEAAFEAARDIATAGLRPESAENAAARMDAAERHVIVAETLSDEELPALAARLRADPSLRAVLVRKPGSDRSDAVARIIGGLTNVDTEFSDDVVSADGPLSRVSMAALDRILSRTESTGGRIHVWAGRTAEFDPTGLAENSALRQALFTILDAMSVTASFQRMELLDAAYRLMATQA